MTIIDQIAALERVKRIQEESLDSLRALASGTMPNLAGTAAYRVGRNIEALDLAIARLKVELK